MPPNNSVYKQPMVKSGKIQFPNTRYHQKYYIPTAIVIKLFLTVVRKFGTQAAQISGWQIKM